MKAVALESLGTRWARRICGLGFCCVSLAAAAATQASDTPPPSADAPGVVNITGTKDPEIRSYRSVQRGLEAFDEYRHLAPAAELRFRFAHKGGLPVTEADGLALKLVSDETSFPIPVDPDGHFSVMRSQAAFEGDATFFLNRKKGMFVYYPSIRTPGLPPNVRRLGDLRLECFVTQAVAKDEIPFMARMFINTVLRTTNWCAKENFSTGFPAYGQVTKVTLRDGAKKGEFSFENGKFSAPIGSRNFSDDALIELTYVEAASVDAAVKAP